MRHTVFTVLTAVVLCLLAASCSPAYQAAARINPNPYDSDTADLVVRIQFKKDVDPSMQSFGFENIDLDYNDDWQGSSPAFYKSSRLLFELGTTRFTFNRITTPPDTFELIVEGAFINTGDWVDQNACPFSGLSLQGFIEGDWGGLDADLPGSYHVDLPCDVASLASAQPPRPGVTTEAPPQPGVTTEAPPQPGVTTEAPPQPGGPTDTPRPCAKSVPDLFGLTSQQAGDVLHAAGYSYTFEQGSYQVDMVGLVVRQSPPGGTCKSPQEVMVVYYVNLPSENPFIDADPCELIRIYFDTYNREDIVSNLALPRVPAYTPEELEKQRSWLQWYFNEYDIQYSNLQCLRKWNPPEDSSVIYMIYNTDHKFNKPDRPSENITGVMRLQYIHPQWNLAGPAPYYRGAPAVGLPLIPEDGKVFYGFREDSTTLLTFTFQTPEEQQPAIFPYAEGLTGSPAAMFQLEVEIQPDENGPWKQIYHSPRVTTYGPGVHEEQATIPELNERTGNQWIVPGRWRLTSVNNLFEETKAYSGWQYFTINFLPNS